MRRAGLVQRRLAKSKTTGSIPVTHSNARLADRLGGCLPSSSRRVRLTYRAQSDLLASSKTARRGTKGRKAPYEAWRSLDEGQRILEGRQRRRWRSRFLTWLNRDGPCLENVRINPRTSAGLSTEYVLVRPRWRGTGLVNRRCRVQFSGPAPRPRNFAGEVSPRKRGQRGSNPRGGSDTLIAAGRVVLVSRRVLISRC